MGSCVGWVGEAGLRRLLACLLASLPLGRFLPPAAARVLLATLLLVKFDDRYVNIYDKLNLVSFEMFPL